jgi:nicotinamidase-related amidase
MKSLLLLIPLLGAPVRAVPPATLAELGGATLAPGHLRESVVVIIDAQNEYTSGRLPLAGVEAALTQTARLLARARAAGVPVVHVQQVSPIGRGLFEPGSTSGAFAPAARPMADEIVITKRLPNAFAGTALSAVLHATGRRQLIVSGYMTHMCVSATARAAFDAGYSVTVIADACATRDLPDGAGGTLAAATVHVVALAELADRFAFVAPTLDAIPD